MNESLRQFDIHLSGHFGVENGQPVSAFFDKLKTDDARFQVILNRHIEAKYRYVRLKTLAVEEL